jgi:hypothetical protein
MPSNYGSLTDSADIESGNDKIHQVIDKKCKDILWTT